MENNKMIKDAKAQKIKKESVIPTKKDVDFTDMKTALEIITAALQTGLVEVPKYNPTDDIEISLYKEMMFLIKHIKKNIWRMRVWMFIVGPLYSLEAKGMVKKQLKEVADACTYVRKHKKELRKYVAVTAMKVVFDPKLLWYGDNYKTGDDVSCRLKSGGTVEERVSRFGAKPVYRDIASIFVRNNDGSEPKNRRCLDEKDNIAQMPTDVIYSNIEKMVPQMTPEDAKFLGKYLSYLNEETKNSPEDVSPKESSSPETESPKDDDYWVKRVKCTENLKNSSKPKDDDSQS
jgi:hypothetical protein